ncbi:MAG: peptidoglycan DD-metalloendopeptidase family protein [Rikenellaceae bacterium]|jgi:murein DD-endopeptidase MepM/ murein hydrolase activator NlpD|nr:peptidoglycan DD-metalloendopeptidase family protein [Rikenellaceae bacterium]
MLTKKNLIIAGSILLVIIIVGALVWVMHGRGGGPEPEAEEQPVALLYGIPYELYEQVDGVVANGQSMSVLLGASGVSAQRIDKLSRVGTDVFDPRSIRAGNDYHLFFTQDTLRSLAYMVYQQSRIDYLVFDLRADSITVSKYQKEVVTVRRHGQGEIASSLWNCMVDGGMSPAMAMELSDIYAWTIDFFGLQKGDHFTVVYDEMYVDSTSVGTGRIWGAIFNHSGKDYYAIPFKQGSKVEYWDEQGNSLRKNLLKAPLKFLRISSRFTNARFHPVLKYYRPHHGVDYAAPSGTPVVSVADGTVISCGWAGGGGNTVKIRHARGLVSCYMHLRGYAKGIRAGAHVSQGELIGYVGSTGLSTGPHLDFRLYVNGKPMDPLKVPTEPTEPIAAVNREAFAAVRDRTIAEVMGTLPDSLRIVNLDSIYTAHPGVPVAVVGTPAAKTDSTKNAAPTTAVR